jgi:hypothetical protein
VGGALMTAFGQVRSARPTGAKARYLEEGLRNMDFYSLIKTAASSLARFWEFSGLVSADRWRMSEWRLAAQQQRKRTQAQRGARDEAGFAAERIHWS